MEFDCFNDTSLNRFFLRVLFAFVIIRYWHYHQKSKGNETANISNDYFLLFISLSVFSSTMCQHYSRYQEQP